MPPLAAPLASDLRSTSAPLEVERRRGTVDISQVDACMDGLAAIKLRKASDICE
jgi:hypothetical protein